MLVTQSSFLLHDSVLRREKLWIGLVCYSLWLLPQLVAPFNHDCGRHPF